jgi:hypothetical protein
MTINAKSQEKSLFLISCTQLNISQRTDRQSLVARKTGNSFRRRTTLTASVCPLWYPRTTLFTRNLTDDAWNLPVPVPRAELTADSVIWSRYYSFVYWLSNLTRPRANIWRSKWFDLLVLLFKQRWTSTLTSWICRPSTALTIKWHWIWGHSIKEVWKQLPAQGMLTSNTRTWCLVTTKLQLIVLYLKRWPESIHPQRSSASKQVRRINI